MRDPQSMAQWIERRFSDDFNVSASHCSQTAV